MASKRENVGWSQEHLTYLRRYGSRLTAAQVAKKTGKTKNAVFHMASRLDIQLAGKKGNRKFSDELIMEVRVLLETTKLTHKQIGEMKGISTSYIGAIATGKRAPKGSKPLTPRVKKPDDIGQAFVSNQTVLNSIFGAAA